MDVKEIIEVLNNTQLRSIVLEKLEINELRRLQNGIEGEINQRQYQAIEKIQKEFDDLIRTTKFYDLHLECENKKEGTLMTFDKIIVSKK